MTKHLHLSFAILVLLSAIGFTIYHSNLYLKQTKVNIKKNQTITPTATTSTLKCLFKPCDLLEGTFATILKDNMVMFLIEPHLLMQLLGHDPVHLEDFKWRFSLPMDFQYRRNSLTVGVFEGDVDKIHINYIRRQQIYTPKSPFTSAGSTISKSIGHIIYELVSADHTRLNLHVVVFRPVKHLLWIAALPAKTAFEITDDSHYGPAVALTLHYGRWEQIFDRFDTRLEGDIVVPDDLSWFLGQLSTSRYLHCDPGKAAAQSSEVNHLKMNTTATAIINTKAMMRQLQMQFWLAAVTLLGWHQQCHILPWTGDTHFATWAKYLGGRNRTATIFAAATRNHLKPMYRFGEPLTSAGYVFSSTTTHNETINLFFVYRHNVSHLLMPIHDGWRKKEWSLAWYPVYELCSAELLDYKVLVPCQSELIVETEYGPNWKVPAKDNQTLNRLPMVLDPDQNSGKCETNIQSKIADSSPPPVHCVFPTSTASHHPNTSHLVALIVLIFATHSTWRPPIWSV